MIYGKIEKNIFIWQTLKYLAKVKDKKNVLKTPQVFSRTLSHIVSNILFGSVKLNSILQPFRTICKDAQPRLVA